MTGEVMTFSLDQVLQIVGTLFAVGLAFWGFAKYVFGRIDKQNERLSASIKRAHERVDELPSIYVRRDEVMNHFERIERGLNSMGSEVNKRLDALYLFLSTNGKEGGGD